MVKTQPRETLAMTATDEFGQELMAHSEFEAPDESQRLPHEDDDLAMAAAYQQIADRRAQLENADILRRARAL
jgi:hypothetical protein